MKKLAYYGGMIWMALVILLAAFSGFSLATGGPGFFISHGYGEVFIFLALGAPGWYLWDWGNPHKKGNDDA